MIFEELALNGLWLISQERKGDDRGYFARFFCDREYRAHGLNDTWPQQNLSANRQAGTLRGLHLQAAPHEETKVVSCIAGRIWDVAVDLRPASPTRGRWFGTELSAENGRMLYIPSGFAHGFLTLADDSLVHYLMGAAYVPGADRGIRWDDPEIAIQWPAEVRQMSERDRELPAYSDFIASLN